MKRSTDRILTSHAGSLPRPADLLAMNQAKQRGEPYNENARMERISSSVADVVRLQKDSGIDIVNDGEHSKLSFLQYPQERLSGFELVQEGRGFYERRDWQEFEDFYREELGRWGSSGSMLVCSGPIKYVGQAQLQADIDNLKTATEGVPAEEAFMTACSPGTFGRGVNRYYKDDEEFLTALGEAMSEEYKAIVDAGFVLQIDDPGLPDTWDSLNPAPTIDEYKRYAAIRVEALNNALRDIPEERVRYHICWGSWHGPHTTDIELRDIIDLLLQVKAQTYSLEAGNVRHEHDWKVWSEVKLPEGKILMPGVVSHATNVVEHPELVADRLIQYAELVGRENVIAGTDCGMSRVHRQICWAKLRVLAQGAAQASQQLWRVSRA